MLTGRLASDLRGLGVDLLSPILDPPLGELQPGGLERVGLDDLRARVEHRCVHALDHVGPVEHQHLVTASGQPVVALERQVELLERGSHAPVVDDHALARGCQEIAHLLIVPNLDRVLARLGWGCHAGARSVPPVLS